MKFGMFHLSKHRRPFYFTPEHNCWWFTNFACIFYSFILIHQKILTILLFVFWPRYAYHVLHGYIFKCIHLNASWINTVKIIIENIYIFSHFQLKNVWNMNEKDGESAWKKRTSTALENTIAIWHSPLYLTLGFQFSYQFVKLEFARFSVFL